MIAILKRYSVAFIILLVVILMMMIGTLGVEKFGNNLFKDINKQDMQPRGKEIKL
jgi:hypothetical protein